MDSKLYVEWRESLGKWIVKYQGELKSQQETQEKAINWVESNYPGHAFEVERVQIRENSPRGVRRGEWRK